MAVETTEDGYLIVDARISRAGIYEYHAGQLRQWGVPVSDRIPDGAIFRVYRDSSDVFDEKSLKSFELVPFTDGHPKEPVSPDTVSKEFQGIVEAPVVQDGNHARTKIRIMNKKAISDFRAGSRQLSAGYKAVLDMSPGKTPAGDVYDIRQREITGNHVAMVRAGRAGSAVLIDGEGIMSEKNQQLDAVEYGRMRQRVADVEEKISALTKENDRLEGENEGLKKSVISEDEIKARVESGVKDALAAKAERERIVKKAGLMAPGMVVSDEQSMRDIMVSAIKSQRSDIEISDDFSDDRVAGIFDGIRPAEAPAKKDFVRPAGKRAHWQAIHTADGRPDFGRIRGLVRG